MKSFIIIISVFAISIYVSWLLSGKSIHVSHGESETSVLVKRLGITVAYTFGLLVILWLVINMISNQLNIKIELNNSNLARN